MGGTKMALRDYIGRDKQEAKSGHRALFDRQIARPSPTEMGLGVTIGIALAPQFLSVNEKFIVTVTDLRESFGDELQGIDIGRSKSMRISRDWGFLYAGGDARFANPIARRARQALMFLERHSMETIKDAVCKAYSEIREEQVVKRFLMPINYDNLVAFQKHGRRDYGAENIQKNSR
jgi:hypothetical protein